MDRLEDATRIMVRNHRNHPSVWGWGGGINHRGPVERLHFACKEEDPTRITMNNGTLWTGPQHSGVTDLYSVMDYRGARVPEGEFLFGMEHSGSSNVAGQQRLISRYLKDPARIGLTSWCGHDGHSFMKRGKSRPNLSVWKAALWDIHRRPKPTFFWYQCELLDKPLVHIPDSRAQNDKAVRVFSNCEEVELYADGKLVKRKKSAAPERMEGLKAPPFVFDFPEGQKHHLVAKGYNGGKMVSSHERRPEKAAAELKVAIETKGFSGVADGSSVLMVTADIRDAEGTIVSSSKKPVQFALTGPGKILDASHLSLNPATPERGVATVLVQVGAEPGTLKISASCEGLTADHAELILQEYKPSVFDGSEYAFKDPVHLRLDLGNPDQHVQDGWTAWNQNEGMRAEFIDERGVGLLLDTTDAKAKWTNSFGVPGDLSFMIEDGLIVSAGESVSLSLKSLPAGRYRLRTWHHVLSNSREEVPSLKFSSPEAVVKLPENYLPTFGKKIQVSEAGGGNAGDGGSNLGAAGFAECELLVKEKDEKVLLKIEASSAEGQMTFNGLELLEL